MYVYIMSYAVALIVQILCLPLKIKAVILKKISDSDYNVKIIIVQL